MTQRAMARADAAAVGWAVGRTAPAGELWLDGGHNPAAGQALAAASGCNAQAPDASDLRDAEHQRHRRIPAPLAAEAASLTAVSIPGEAATLPAQATAEAAREVGFEAGTASDVAAALDAILTADPEARVLICGSLYLAGNILRENG